MLNDAAVLSDALIKKGVKHLGRVLSLLGIVVLSDALIKKGVKLLQAGLDQGGPVLSDALIKKGVKRPPRPACHSQLRAERCPDQEGSETCAAPACGRGYVLSDALIKKGVKLREVVVVHSGDSVLSDALIKKGVKHDVHEIDEVRSVLSESLIEKGVKSWSCPGRGEGSVLSDARCTATHSGRVSCP